MKAMVLDECRSADEDPLRLRDVPDPVPGPGEVRVRISVCAVCRTDLHVIEGDLPHAKKPVIPGHQAVGRVDQLGPGCRRLGTGRRIGIAWLRFTDGTCRYCRRGRENLCPASRYTGYHEDGGYAEMATVPEEFAYELPEGLDDAPTAPLLCAGLIGYRALKRAAVPDGGRLLLVGFGSSAHVVLPIALLRGYRVHVVTRAEGHRRLSLEMGAAWAGGDLARLPEKMDSAILFAPAGELVPPVMEALDRGGTLAIAGIHLSDIPVLRYERHLFHDRQIRSVAANTREDGRELLAEAVAAKVRPRVKTYPLVEANLALQDLKHSRLDGTGVLEIGD